MMHNFTNTANLSWEDKASNKLRDNKFLSPPFL